MCRTEESLGYVGQKTKLAFMSMTACVCQVVEEMRNLMEYYEKETGEQPDFLGVALSSRKNMCIHPDVSI